MGHRCSIAVVSPYPQLATLGVGRPAGIGWPGLAASHWAPANVLNSCRQGTSAETAVLRVLDVLNAVDV